MEQTRNISFDDGKESFTVNGGYTIRFQPTDLAFAERIFDAMEEMSGIQNRYAAMGDDLPDVDFEAVLNDGEQAEKHVRETRERLETFQAIDRELRAKIDGLFGDGAAEGIFGKTNLTAHAGGFPLWLNLLTAVLDVFPEAAKREAGLSDERLRAATSKYTQKYAEMRQFHQRRKGKRRN